MWRWILAAAAVAIIVGAVVLQSLSGTPVDVATAAKGDIRAFVDERGSTRLPHVYRITTPQTGRILPLEVQEGDAVDEGQVVAQMEPADLDTIVAEGEARVKQLEARIVVNEDSALENSGLEEIQNVLVSMDRVVEAATAATESGKARSDWATERAERREQLANRDAVSDEDYRQAKVEETDARVDYDKDVLNLRALEALRAAMHIWPRGIADWLNRKKLQKNVLLSEKDEATARLEQAKRDRERGTLRSPVSGVVLHRHVSNERVLSAGQLLLEIGRIEDLEVETDILSQDVVDIQVGNPADIYGPAIGAEPVRGKVARVYPAGFTKLSSLGVEQQRVKVIVAFDEGVLERLAKAGRKLGPEFRVRVRIYTATGSDATFVPRNAVFKGESGQWQAFVVRGRKAALTPVTLGIANDDQVEILSGIQPGDRVVLAPDAELRDGERVTARLLNGP